MGRWRNGLVAAAASLGAIACSEVNPLYGLTESGGSSTGAAMTSTVVSSSGGATAMSASSVEVTTEAPTTDAVTTDGVTTGATTTGSPPSSSGDSGGLEEHRIFLTSSIHGGDFGGVAGADAICGALAGGVDLPTSFRAIVSVDGDAAADRLTVTGPVRTLDGQLVAMDADDLWDGSVDVAIIADEHGDTDQNVGTWTGSSFEGDAMEPNCDGWTDAAPQADGIRGQKSATGTAWLSWGPDNCNKAFHLYCLEQG